MDHHVIKTYPTYQLEQTIDKLKEIRIEDTDVIIVNIMTNDAKKQQKGKKKQRKRAMKEIKRLQENIVEIITMRMPPDRIVWLESPPLLTTPTSSIQRFNNLSKGLMERIGGNYAQTLLTRKDMGGDGLHINDSSRHLMVQSMAAAVLNQDPNYLYHSRFVFQRLNLHSEEGITPEYFGEYFRNLWAEQQWHSSIYNEQGSQRRRALAQPPTEVARTIPPRWSTPQTSRNHEEAIPMYNYQRRMQYDPIQFDSYGRLLPVYNNEQLEQRGFYRW